MKDKILHWIFNGKTGASSMSMAGAVLGVQINDVSHPHDPADLNRCLLLIEDAPEIRQYLDKVAAISKSWAALIARFGELEQCFVAEAGRDWCKAKSAPKTYALMKEILKTVDSW